VTTREGGRKLNLINTDIIIEWRTDLPFRNFGSRCVRRIIDQYIPANHFPLDDQEPVLYRTSGLCEKAQSAQTNSPTGYWPDGLYTAPTYEAMIFDIKTLKRIGYNMLRKHIKVEPALYYAAADELGILIMQDMPSLATTKLPNKAQQAEFERQVESHVKQLRSYSSIFAWVSVYETSDRAPFGRTGS
jgi:hypothetical protein